MLSVGDGEVNVDVTSRCSSTANKELRTVSPPRQVDEEPLLPPQRLDIEAQDDHTARSGAFKSWSDGEPRLFLGELSSLGTLALPLAVQQLTVFAVSVVGVAFVGRLGELELGAAVLSNSVFVATGQVTVMGVASAMETLCGQAYGAKNFTALGVIFQRALLICSLTAALILMLWSQLERVLNAMGQDRQIAAAASRYTLANAPSLVMLAFTETGRRYLMAQNVVKPMAIIFAFGTLLAPLFNWLFIFGLGFGMLGGAAALAAVNATNSALLLAYIVRHNARLRGTDQEPWSGWSSAAFSNWPQYIYIAVPSLLMLCLEWWLFEAMIILAGLLSDPKLSLAATGVLLNVLATVYAIPTGIGNAASTRVSNALGAADAARAARAARAALAAVLAAQAVVAGAMLAGRRLWGRAFSAEARVADYAAAVFPIVAALCVSDGVNGVMLGVIRGCGRQTRAALTNAFSFWAIGLPTSLLLAFKLSLALAGLWSGLLAAATVQALTITTMVLRLDWAAEAQRAGENVRSEAEALKLAAHDDGAFGSRHCDEEQRLCELRAP